MHNKTVIFGASGGAVKVAKTLKNINAKFLFFVDNDKKKWGTTVEGKKVRPPDVLKEDEYDILIASDYQSEIEEQLKEMGLIDRIILKEEFIMEYADEHISEFDYLKDIHIDKKKKGRDKCVILGLEEGLVPGGIESFSFTIANKLKESFKNLYIYTKETKYPKPDGLEENIVYFNFDYDSYWDGIKTLVKKISENLPCTVIDNWQNQVLVAVSIIKRCIPDAIKCVSIIHNDKIFLYRKAAYMNKYMDAVTGVSRRINGWLNNDFGIDSRKIFYKESPVKCERILNRQYSVDGDSPLQIGFAARMTRFQKRVDLLPSLALALKKSNVKFHLNIAGTGDYYGKLEESISKNDLGECATLFGNVPRKDMAKFWDKQDIFVSVSDFEGASISMLEAMSHGVVPVVTNVSGVEEFVVPGINGYYSETGDIDGISRHIAEIDKDRKKLIDLGENAHGTIRKKCSLDDYVECMKTAMRQC